LHLASHGFFVPFAGDRGVRQDLRTFYAANAQSYTDVTSLPNPLLRSAIVLAGYNTWRRGEQTDAHTGTGLLTGEDVSGMDLSGTELVVLSACETGFGDVHVGEGVFGLRRAFVLAGAKMLVMSLWKVPDEQTRELMVDFYRRLLAGEGRGDALRSAQLAMKEKQKYRDPFWWGAFICQGDPGPLRSGG
jgi:CHAT domain-containing protein